MYCYKKKGHSRASHKNSIIETLNPVLIPKQQKKKSLKEPISYYELLELEKQKTETESVKITIRRNFPIAPDGFIPNSVVKKFFKLLEPGPNTEKKVWKLKWVLFYLAMIMSHVIMCYNLGLHGHMLMIAAKMNQLRLSLFSIRSHQRACWNTMKMSKTT